MSYNNLNIQLTNTTSQPQDVYLMDFTGYYNSVNGIVSQNKYSWNLNFLISLASINNYTNLSVVIAQNGLPYQTYNLSTVSGSIYFKTTDQIVQSLNSLKLCTFYEDGTNILATNSSKFQIASINVNNQIATSLFTGSATNGTLIYAGLDLENDSLVQINPLNTFWQFGSNPRCFVTNNPFGSFEQGGTVSFNINSNQQGKQVYIGISGDDLTNVYLNNSNIITINPTLTSAQIGNINTNLGTSYPLSTTLNSFWFILPILLNYGNNLIQVNQETSLGIGPVTFGVEVYDNTQAEIIASTSYSNLNLLYSTKDYAPTPFI